jgi:ABC-2 type transport system permease protein
MRSTLAIEWLKLKRYRTFWVLLALFAILMPLWNYEIASGVLKFGGGGKGKPTINLLNTAYSFPDVWANVGFHASLFVLFISILVIIVTTNEFTYRTHRQNIIDGWQRVEFYHAKVRLVAVLSALCTLYMFISGALLGWSFSGSLSGMFTDIYKVGYFFLLCLDYLGFALLLGIWLKRSGLAIGLFMLYATLGENIVKSLINWKFDTEYGNFLPLQASDELLPFQLMRMIKNMIASGTISMTTYVIVTLVWCAIYYVVGRMLLLKRDW